MPLLGLPIAVNANKFVCNNTYRELIRLPHLAQKMAIVTWQAENRQDEHADVQAHTCTTVCNNHAQRKDANG